MESSPQTGRSLVGLARVAVTWLAALMGPPVIWSYTLEQLTSVHGDLRLVLQAGIGFLLGLLARDGVHATALLAVAVVSRRTGAVPLVAMLVAGVAGRLLRRRSKPEEIAAEKGGLLLATKDLLELAPRFRKRLLASALTILLLSPFIEAAARASLRRLDAEALRQRINSYYDVDATNPRLYRPAPGYTKTFGELAAVRSGASNGGRLRDERTILGEAIEKGVVARDQVLHMNALGFKGDEFPRAKPPGETRILCIGDSCTFGLSCTSYAQVADRALAAQGRPRIRVVNGGAEGYSPLEATLRVPEYLAIEPDAIFVYIGWNSLTSAIEDPAHLASFERIDASFERIDEFVDQFTTPPSFFRLDTLALAYRVRGSLSLKAQEAVKTVAAPQEAPKKTWEAFASPSGDWPRYSPRCTERLLARLREAGFPKHRIALATLPALLRTDKAPSARALELAHLPDWAHGNAYGLAMAAERYNAWLRELAAHEGMKLADLEAWQRSLKAPPEEVFFDSTHLVLGWQVALGEHLAPFFREMAAVREEPH